MIDDDTRRAVLTMIRRGWVTVPEAAKLAGVQRQLVRYWCRRARIMPSKARDEVIAKQWRKVLNDRHVPGPMATRRRSGGQASAE